MAKTQHVSSVLDMEPDKLLTVLTNPAFLVAQQKTDPTVVDAWVDEVTRTEDRVVLELHARHLARRLFGVDRTKTEESVTTYTWDVAHKRCTWSFRSAHGALVRVHGTDQIEPHDDGARLSHEFYVEIDIPLLGRLLERRILGEIYGRKEPYGRVLHEFYGKLGEQDGGGGEQELEDRKTGR